MAQKDIQDIAAYMKQVDESKALEDEACTEACKECEEAQMQEDDAVEDEIIDKSELGFIDDNDQQVESDEFYSEDDEDTFEEDVSDCLVKDLNEAEEQATIEIEVYNEDGFGEHFAQEVAKVVPGVDAKVKKTLPNADLLIEIHGSKNDLQKAFAFYVGQKDYASLSQDDKEDFESRLMFDDGDTLAEADYREAVAHCLDPIGVNASTANLADQDTCALSLIKEEKAKRTANKFLKCLKENDFSSLTDDELDKLDKIQTAIDNGEDINDALNDDDPVWKQILKSMGVTQKEWDDMTPEQRDKFWARSPSNRPALNPTGFGKGVHVGFDPETGKAFRYQKSFEVTNPETGEKEVTMFNPNYDADHSMHQHPSAAKRQAAKDAKDLEQANKEKAAKEAMKSARGKDTWDTYEFAQMLTALDDKQRKELMNQLIDDVEKDNPDDSRKAGEEIMFIKSLFGKKLTLRDIAKAWGKSAPGVMKFADETIAIWQKSLRDAGIKNRAELLNSGKAKFNAFKEQLKKNMEARRKGSIVSGR